MAGGFDGKMVISPSRIFCVRWLGTAVFALIVVSACGSEVSVSSSGARRIDLSQAHPADFVARGSVEQVYVTDAEPGITLELVGTDGAVIQSGRADEQGAFIFRDVP